MDVLIESTRSFDKDLGSLSEAEQTAAVKKINHCANLFPTQKAEAYHQLSGLPLSSGLNGYESSLYTLKISQQLRIILAVDEDPIFGQVIFTLFRAVQHKALDKAYQGVAESLSQELLHHKREAAQVY
ncbi:MAG: hypothetical protein F6J92_25390 [Symploca sp. SIO1A3]|nr:hypothetical protein [Symploca sp. SIO1A3]